jgi:hypothetical protein
MHQKCTLQPIQGVTLYQEGEDVPQEVSPGLKVLAGASCGEHTVQAGWQFQIDDEQQTVEAVVTVEDPERCVALCSKKGGDLRPLDIHKVGAGSVDMDHTTAPGFALYLAERSWEDQLPAASTAPADPRTHVDEIPEALAKIILQMLAKAPGDRPRNAAEIGKCLQAIRREASASK